MVKQPSFTQRGFIVSYSDVLGRLLGFSQMETIESFGLRWNAAWIGGRGGWLCLALLVVVGLVAFLYSRHLLGDRRIVKWYLPIFRAMALVGIVVILAQPVVLVRIRHVTRPSLWFLVDDTASMSIRDESPSTTDASTEEQRKTVVDPRLTAPSIAGEANLSRTESVLEAFFRDGGKKLADLAKAYRIRFFAVRRSDGVDLVLQPDTFDSTCLEKLRSELTAKGDTTSLGAAFADILRRKAGMQLAGVVVISDFNHNSGPSPEAFVSRLNVPVFCLGVGRSESQDLAVELQLPPFMKKNEKSSVTVVLRQDGLSGERVHLKVLVRKPKPARDSNGTAPQVSPTAIAALSPDHTAEDGESLLDRTIDLTERVVTVEVPFTPSEIGQHVFVVEAEGLPLEKVTQNNRAVRDTFVRDYFVRVLFVEEEPTWEWRFMREVFHRDPLVGPEGFRTYLRSADPRVRERNPLFLTTLSLPRREFFANDVIILGDVPASAISPNIMEMIDEFVNEMGGGLVFCVGPRFGPGQWNDTRLARLLPVEVLPLTRIRETTFVPRLTPEAALFDFMRLGENEDENRMAWENIGKLSWYYPVQRVRPLATVLASHPYDTCPDGKTRQPLIAVQKVGRGEVVYVGTNEMWRLRRKYGEKYYRQFWGQMIHRLAIQHALGVEKRFVVRSDHREYRSGDEAVFTVEAYDADFRPLNAAQLPTPQLVGTLLVPTEAQPQMREIRFSETRSGWFESRLKLYNPGEYRLVVEDPLTKQRVETSFLVSNQSVEFQQITRNLERQRLLAQLTGGKSYELSEWDRLLNDLPREAQIETEVRELEIWNTWPFFLFVVGLLLSEWFARKWLNLR